MLLEYTTAKYSVRFLTMIYAWTLQRALAYYDRVMYRHRFSGPLLRPSLFSSILCGGFTVGVITIANWSAVLKHLLFYDYFFGTEGLVTVLQDSHGSGSAIGHALTNKSLMHNATILFGAIAAGVVLYIVLRVLVKLISSITMTVKELEAVDTPAKHAVEHELEVRTGIRLLVALVWTVYMFIFIKVILPFCVLASEVGFDEKSKVGEGIGYILFAFTVLFLASHLHTILARLFLLRLRVFGSPPGNF